FILPLFVSPGSSLPGIERGVRPRRVKELQPFYLSGEMKYNLVKPQRGGILVESTSIKEPKLRRGGRHFIEASNKEMSPRWGFVHHSSYLLPKCRPAGALKTADHNPPQISLNKIIIYSFRRGLHYLAIERGVRPRRCKRASTFMLPPSPVLSPFFLYPMI